MTTLRNLDWAAIIKAVPLWIGAAVAVLSALIAQADANGWAEVSQYAGIALTWLAGALAIIRKVTPASADTVGLPTKS